MKSEKPNSRRNALKILVGAGLLAVVGVVVSTLKIFTGSSEPSTTTPVVKTTSSFASTAPIASATSGVVPPTTSIGAPLQWPRLKVTNVKSLQLMKPYVFDYPTVGTSNIIVKLGLKADNGIGPDGDIVAFSRICQHQGCIYDFYPQSSVTTLYYGVSTTRSNPPEGVCGCHGSVYDFSHNGAVIGGPAPYPVPRVLLEYDQTAGDIYVTGMAPPVIYGKSCAANDSLLKCDAGEGQIVTQITLTSQ